MFDEMEAFVPQGSENIAVVEQLEKYLAASTGHINSGFARARWGIFRRSRGAFQYFLHVSAVRHFLPHIPFFLFRPTVFQMASASLFSDALKMSVIRASRVRL